MFLLNKKLKLVKLIVPMYSMYGVSTILIALIWARFPSGPDYFKNFKRVVKYQTFQTSFYGCML